MHFSKFIGELVQYNGSYEQLKSIGITELATQHQLTMDSGEVLSIKQDFESWQWVFELEYSSTGRILFIPIEWCSYKGATIKCGNENRQLHDIVEI